MRKALTGIRRGRAAAAAAVVVLLIAVSASVSAQTPDDSIERPRIQLGPLGLTPSIAVTNLGVDTNVFNQFEEARSDFTFTVSPQLDAWLRAGRWRLRVASRSDLVYFQRYSSERSIDGVLDSRLERRGSRVTPWITAASTSGRQRFGYEIDLRFRRDVRDLAAGVDTRVAGQTRVGVSARRMTYRHDPDAEFGGSNLREALDRRRDALGVTFQHPLTPLTTFVVSGERIYDRFEFTPARDAESNRIDTGFDLSPSALIAGRGRIGYRRFVGTGGALPDYSGPVASVAASSVVGGRTRIDVTTDRDLDYSWEAFYPYYVRTGATVTVTPRLTTRWDVRARLGTQRLAYRAATGVPGLLRDRVDRFGLMGAGIGYRLGRDARVGVDVDRERRESPVLRHAYEGFRTGLSVTYGR
jgi:hypothetical protein